MKTNFSHVIGLMSGTSLDGLDVVYVRFDTQIYQNFEIIYSETVPYSKKWKELLQNAITFSEDKLQVLDNEYGKLLGKFINQFIEKNKIKKVDFVASHGHTVFHKPDEGITLQIGNGQEISNITTQKVICDFRTQDVKFGGQGAPLVPIGDELLFGNYESCLNLGGFANISFKENAKRIAYDICPVNIVLNYYVQKLGFEYDNEGKIASEGTINSGLLSTLNSLDYYKKSPPKSLGLEWVQSIIFPLIDENKLEITTILRTFTEHVAIQLGLNISKNKNVLITGGGTFHAFLIERLQHHTQAKIYIPSKKIINFKEALVFAFLGLLRVDNQINCLKSVTGAKRDHSSGCIYLPKI